MRRTVAAAAAVLSLCAAARAEDAAAYRAAKGKAIADVARADKAGKPDDARSAKLLKDLEKRLQTLVGAPQIAGFAKSGKISLDTLSSGDIGGDALDGLVFDGEDGKASLLATTKPLVDGWLKGFKFDARSKQTFPRDLAAALRSANFYTFAISPDAAVSSYGEVEVAPSAGAALAVVQLTARSQDQAPAAPDELIAAVLVGDRLFIASEPVREAIPAIPACEKLAAATLEKSRAKEAAFDASGRKNQKLFDESLALQEKSAEDNRQCFAQRLRDQDFYPKARFQGEALVARLAAGAR